VLGALLFGAALAFGLGAQTAVSNILGSYYLQKTYKEGDMVQMDDMKGVIVKILPTSVIVETSSGQIMIPAKDFIEKKSILVKNQ
jgi:small-conductance mechanosensitive channel